MVPAALRSAPCGSYSSATSGEAAPPAVCLRPAGCLSPPVGTGTAPRGRGGRGGRCAAALGCASIGATSGLAVGAEGAQPRFSVPWGLRRQPNKDCGAGGGLQGSRIPIMLLPTPWCPLELNIATTAFSPGGDSESRASPAVQAGPRELPDKAFGKQG